MPLEAWRKGDFSSLFPDVVITDPNTGLPFQNNVIPANRLNSVSQKIQDRFYPLPNYGNTSVLENQNYREMLTRPYDASTYWTVRGDHRFTDKATFFSRFTWQRQSSSALREQPADDRPVMEPARHASARRLI